MSSAIPNRCLQRRPARGKWNGLIKGTRFYSEHPSFLIVERRICLNGRRYWRWMFSPLITHFFSFAARALTVISSFIARNMCGCITEFSKITWYIHTMILITSSGPNLQQYCDFQIISSSSQHLRLMKPFFSFLLEMLWVTKPIKAQIQRN